MPDMTDEPLQNFREKCRRGGYKVTPQRTRIFAEVLQIEGHPDAETIFENVREEFATISRDTVYRTLGLLEELGLICRVSIIGGPTRFDPRTGQHHHFICTECGSIRDFDSPEADSLRLPDRVRSFGRVQSLRVEVRGVCKQCRSENETN